MVLVIIGLLLGAVLKGQELIVSARVNKLIRDMTGSKAAITAFQDRYKMLPGDSSTAETKVGNGAVNCQYYCDNGLCDDVMTIALVNNNLAAAGFYSGPVPTVFTDPWPTSTCYLNNPGGGPIYVHQTYTYFTPSGAVSGDWVNTRCKRVGSFPPSCWARWIAGLTMATDGPVVCVLQRGLQGRPSAVAV